MSRTVAACGANHPPPAEVDETGGSAGSSTGGTAPVAGATSGGSGGTAGAATGGRASDGGADSGGTERPNTNPCQ